MMDEHPDPDPGPDLYDEFEDDLPDPVMSSARVAALDAEILYIEGILRPEDDDNAAERTYLDVLGEWLRDHDRPPTVLILALMERLGSRSLVDRCVDPQMWTAKIESERLELAAEDVLTSSAYAVEVGGDEDEGGGSGAGS